MSDWFDEGGAGSPCSVAGILDGPAMPWVLECVGLGALVSLGLTSDGGALGVTVTVDGRWRREYFRDSESAESWLKGASLAVEAAKASPAASSGPRRRERAPRGR